MNIFRIFPSKNATSSLPFTTWTRCFTNSSNVPRIGWVGTGVMGRYMCQHIIEKKGNAMTVYNRTKSKCEPLAQMGATIADTPKQVAENSDIIFTMVGYPHDVENVILDKNNGILAGCKENSIIVDMTTSTPSLAVEIQNECKKLKNVETLDAPVSGGDIGAKNGTLSIMCGGDESTFNTIYPYFECFGTNIRHLGGNGKGQHTKMVNQILIANNMIGVCEGLIYAHCSGLDLKNTISAVGSGAAGSFSINILGNRIIDGDLDPGFFVEHFIKDMGIALDESKKMGLSLPGLALANQLYIALKAQGYGKKGTQALILAIESMAGKDHFKKLEFERIKN